MSDQARERALRPIYNALDTYQYSKALKLTYTQPQCDWPITIALRAHCLERLSKKLDACREIRILLSCLSLGEEGKDNGNNDNDDDDWSEIDEMIWILGLGSEGDRSTVGTHEGEEKVVGTSGKASSSAKAKGKKGKGKSNASGAANKKGTSTGASAPKNVVSSSSSSSSSQPPLDMIHVLDLPKHQVQKILHSSKYIANTLKPEQLRFKAFDIVDETVIATIAVTLKALRLYQTQANLCTKSFSFITSKKKNVNQNELISLLKDGYHAQLKVIATKQHVSFNNDNKHSFCVKKMDNALHTARSVLLAWEEAQFTSMSLVKYASDDCPLYKSWCAFATIQHWKSCKKLLELLTQLGTTGTDDERKKLEQKAAVLPRLAEVWMQRVCSKSNSSLEDSFPPSADDFRIFIECCDIQGKYSDMIEILTNVQCGTHKEGRQINDEIDVKSYSGSLIQLSNRERLETLAQLHVKLHEFDIAAKIYSGQLLELLPDQWMYWEELMKCSLKSYDQDHDAALRACGNILKQVMAKEDKLRDEGKSPRVPLRAPQLFRIHMISEGILHCHKKNVEELCDEIKSYGDIFASQTVCCFQDLRQYIKVMIQNGTESEMNITKEASQLVKWAESIREANNPYIETCSSSKCLESESEKRERRAKLRAYIFSIKVTLELWYHSLDNCASDDNDKRLELDNFFSSILPSVDKLVYLWENVLNLGSNPNEGGQKETLPGDDLILIASQLLIHESQFLSQAQKECTSFLAVALLEHAISKSPYNPYMKIAAINIYVENGVTSAAWKWFQSLNVNHIQLDSCSYIILRHLVDAGLYNEAIDQGSKIINLHATSAKDVARFMPISFDNGNIMKGYEMISWQRHEMNNSIQLLEAKSLIMDLAPLLGNVEGDNIITTIGASHGICGERSVDVNRTEKIVRDSSNFYAAPSLLNISKYVPEEGSEVNSWSDNRDLTMNEFEILERTNHSWHIERFFSSAHVHAILTRIVLLIEATKAPKKGKIVQHSAGDEVDIRVQSVIQTINEFNTYINDSTTNFSKVHISLWRVTLLLCKIICVVSTGKCSMDEDSNLSNDSLPSREGKCIDLLQNACNVMNESLTTWKSVIGKFDKDTLKFKFICRLLPESLIPTFVVLKSTANLFALFNWGKRKRQTKPIVSGLADVALSFGTFVKEISDSFFKDLPCTKDDVESYQNSATLKTGVKELVSFKLPQSSSIIVSSVSEDIFEKVTSQKALQLFTLRQRMEPYFVEMISELDTFDVSE